MEVPTLEETTHQIDNTISRIDDLEEKLKELLEHKDNVPYHLTILPNSLWGNLAVFPLFQEIYEDQIDEYLRELEDARTLTRSLKPVNRRGIGS